MEYALGCGGGNTELELRRPIFWSQLSPQELDHCLETVRCGQMQDIFEGRAYNHCWQIGCRE